MSPMSPPSPRTVPHVVIEGTEGIEGIDTAVRDDRAEAAGGATETATEAAKSKRLEPKTYHGLIYLRMARTSSSRRIKYSCSSILISLPAYLPNNTRSP